MTLPRYPRFKAVGIEDQETCKTFIDKNSYGICELNFPNIFIWRNSEHPRLTLLDENLVILLEPDFEPAYFLPPLGRNNIAKTIETCLDRIPRMSRVPEEFARDHGAAFEVDEDRDNFDYIYLAKDLGELRGKKFERKRNRVRKFEILRDYTYEDLRRCHIPECHRLLERWFAAKGDDDPFIKAEKGAIGEALTSYEDLGLQGGVVLVGGRLEAFTFGMGLTGNMAVIPIEIANPEIPGLAQWINREFVCRKWSAYTYINREQDMGLAGLRRAKLSYRPVHFGRKYVIRPLSRDE